jgi:hypothetical protein
MIIKEIIFIKINNMLMKLMLRRKLKKMTFHKDFKMSGKNMTKNLETNGTMILILLIKNRKMQSKNGEKMHLKVYGFNFMTGLLHSDGMLIYL